MASSSPSPSTSPSMCSLIYRYSSFPVKRKGEPSKSFKNLKVLGRFNDDMLLSGGMRKFNRIKAETDTIIRTIWLYEFEGKDHIAITEERRKENLKEKRGAA